MMRVKFNKFERVAGLFVGGALLGFIAFLVSIAVKQGWFENKVYFQTIFQSADGVHTGTTVQMAGLKAGSVENVELLGNNNIQVRFFVLSKFSEKIKQDSSAQLIRPFIIGERVLEVTVGSENSPPLVANSAIKGHETVDFMSLLGGKQLGQHLEVFSGIVENMKVLAQAFFDKDRTQAFIKMFDRVDPLIKNMSVMALEVIKLAKQANKNEQLGTVLSEVAITTSQLNKILPEVTERAPDLVKDMNELMKNMVFLTQEFKVVVPALAEIAPDLPRTSRRAVEALDEAVVLVKALQKSFFLKSGAKEVREEESASDRNRDQEKNQKRLPAEN